MTEPEQPHVDVPADDEETEEPTFSDARVAEMEELGRRAELVGETTAPDGDEAGERE